ncbi:lasso peptide isopeptide bond-forming cyclase [Streptomyces cinnamoneus]|uniref:Asparagine synthase n=1 Tax=Streptomyces cinnamoneus TaxID=53446 RepID=A0A918TAI2_STRCJ|nr:lasso peptide isopeptide bond-forming cyclase [Streptomyces cinnamoneus]GHC39492.1 asparagine synthase [Streptomyces cinnamoneus]
MASSPDQARAGCGGAYFTVLPDCEGARAAARSLPRRPGTRTLDHPSRRPWITGHWADDECIAVTTRRTALAVLGCCPVDAEVLRRHADRLTDLAQLDGLARTLPGSFHLVASLDGRVRIQGTASGLRLVFHTSLGGLQVAATDARILACATGADPDPREVAVRLLWPVPHPLYERSVWQGVSAVPPGEALYLSADGRTTRTSRWWTPPEPVRALADGAPLVRQALTDAVGARTRQGGVVSCDLSGGLDSTSVCFLADRSPARVVASTWPGRDPADDDLDWAKRAAGHLPEVDHVVWDAQASPLVYTDLLDIDDPMDEPTIGVMDRARVLHHLPGLRERGSRLHLTGIGGDHIAWCSEAYYHRLLRRRPLFALGRLRGFKVLFTWPLSGMACALADSRPYDRWLAHAAGRLRDPLPGPVSGTLGWSAPPRLFDWVSDDAAALVHDALTDAAADARPLHPDRGLHTDLEAIRTCTRIVRQWDSMTCRAGLPMASPFFDDRVIEASLAVRPADRVTPWAYKPLLTAAMRGIVPDECLSRTSKAQASMDAADGLREHRGDLMALWEDSHLARMGLVDPALLRALAHRPNAPGLKDAILYSTIACEVWLRSLARGTSHDAPQRPA